MQFLSIIIIFFCCVVNTVCTDVKCYIDPKLAPPTQEQVCDSFLQVDGLNIRSLRVLIEQSEMCKCRYLPSFIVTHLGSFNKLV